ncbi:DUF2786 domain-containing protein [Pseudomonas sp. NPDC086581]|uniref:DUF2786 domain-containing protein n=1 Tax=Pseudomonas sp. NPDC086581 TaxID=3364432 RepID=UPI00382B0C68
MTERTDEKVQAKLRKLLALAERGVGGERDTARRMLDKMLERHGLTIDDLCDEQPSIRWFPMANTHERRLASQIMAKVCDTLSPGVYTHRHNRRTIGVEVTPAEAIEFELHYETLRKALAEHFEIAFSAFVQANRLFPSTPGKDDSPLSEQDMKTIRMAATIQPTPVRSRLAHKREPSL